MAGWLAFSRRVMCDLRTEPGDMASDSNFGVVLEWNRLMDEWAAAIAAAAPSNSLLPSGESDVTWEGEFDPDRAEYLMHSLQKTMHSATVDALVTEEDIQHHGWLTMHIMSRFIDSLENEGRAHAEYVDQLRQSIRSVKERFAEDSAD